MSGLLVPLLCAYCAIQAIRQNRQWVFLAWWAAGVVAAVIGIGYA